MTFCDEQTRGIGQIVWGEVYRTCRLGSGCGYGVVQVVKVLVPGQIGTARFVIGKVDAGNEQGDGGVAEGKAQGPE